MVKAPVLSNEADLDIPECMTDGSGDPLPREYISKWKITESNIEQRFKEIEYTINMLRQRGYKELVMNSRQYDRDFYLLCKGVYRVHNNKLSNRKKVFDYLVEKDMMSLIRDYWKEIMIEFEVRRAETNSSRTEPDEPPLTTPQLWGHFLQHQKHITDAVLNTFNLMIVIWNGSDIKNSESSHQMYKSLVEPILEVLDKDLHPLEVKPDHPQHKMVKACLSALHNWCNKYEECIPDLRQKDALRIVAKYKDSGTSTLRTKSILTYSYLLTENDDQNKSVIEMNDEDISYILRVLRDAIDSPNGHSKKYGYHVDELIEGLNNIAVVDSNKKRLVEAGILPLYTECLKSKKAGVQEGAARGVWALAFDEASLKQILDEPGCMSFIRDLAESENEDVNSAAKGALWKLEGEAEHLQKLEAKKQSSEPASNKKKLKHIMLSYQWDVKLSIIKLRQRLKQEGYRVWIDVEQMAGSTLESMAKAVENAAVVVPVLTEKYKASPACRQEAEYAHHLQRKLVPVRLQPKYRPDGWLGFLLGSTFFYDLTKEEEYEKKICELIKAIGEDAKIQPGEDEDPVAEVDEEAVQPAVGAAGSLEMTATAQQVLGADQSFSAGPVMFDVEQLNCLSWTAEQVEEWLRHHKLEKHITHFPNMDGVLLAELVAFRFTCAETYYELMKQDHNIPMIDLLRLNAAYRTLLR